MDDRWKPWIRVTEEERREAKAAAAREGIDVQEWLARAIRERLERRGK